MTSSNPPRPEIVAAAPHAIAAAVAIPVLMCRPRRITKARAAVAVSAPVVSAAAMVLTLRAAKRETRRVEQRVVALAAVNVAVASLDLVVRNRIIGTRARLSTRRASSVVLVSAAATGLRRHVAKAMMRNLDAPVPVPDSTR